MAILTMATESSKKINQCVVLCGGLGSRLGEITRTTPKPLLPVKGMPFLDILLGEIGRQGYRKILLLAAFESEKIRDFARNSQAAAQFGLEISISVEPDRAGTGGALWHARDLLDDEFLLFNGDSWFDVLLADVEQALNRGPFIGALTLRAIPDASRYGVVEFEAGTVTQFLTRPDREGPGLVNGGVYAFRKSLIEHLGPSCSLEYDVLPALAIAGQLAGIEADGFFIDIGVPASYAAAQSDVPQHLRRPAIFFDRDGVLNQDHGHVGSIDRFEWIEGAREAVRLANAMGYYVFVVTNQAGIGKGLYSEADYQILYRHIQAELAATGAHIDDQRHCPFHPEAVVEEYRRVSDWRKPGPGMLLDLMNKWSIDREGSFMVGDNETDMQAALGAGIAGHRFNGGNLLEFLTLNTPLGNMASKARNAGHD